MTMLTDWDLDPVASFSNFVRTFDFAETVKRRPAVGEPKPISDDSAKIYKFMFGKFADWLILERKKLSEVDHTDLRRFVDKAENGERDLNSKITYHYLRLLERCFSHLNAQPNPASEAINYAVRSNEIARNAPMIALTPEELASFMSALPAVPPGKKSQASWKRHRDRAMQILMAMSGLRVAETIGMKIDEVGAQQRLDGSLELNLTPDGKHPTSHEHTAVLRSEGVPELLFWVQERQALKIPGDLLFPANLTGAPLNKTTVYRQVQATFKRADVRVARAGGRTLRNTFALQHVQDGTPTSELASMLGLAEERSAAAYQYARQSGQI
jgi:integrase/recombinase XerD